MTAPKKSGWKSFSKKKKNANYDQKDGVSGVVYVMSNRGLAWNYFKIGCSRHSGAKRAEALNRNINTGMPGQFKCQFEQKTVDCGLAEKRVSERLKPYRAPTQKTKQEFFCLDFKLAKSIVIEECEKLDKEIEDKKNAETAALLEKTMKSLGTRYMAGRYAKLRETMLSKT